MQISNEFINEASSSPRLLEDMASMEKYMAESYGGRIFIELLQNADDANSSKIKLCDYDGHLIFANNGRPFNKNDVIAISRSGASSKERGVTIGYRGVGFKSTTYLTSEIIIYSDKTYFTFSKYICSKIFNIDESRIPTVRIPFLIENMEAGLNQCIQGLVREGFTTVFIFKNAKFEEFIDEVKEINNGYFLFLRNISSCQIAVKEHRFSFNIGRSATEDGIIVSLNGNKSEQWLVVGDNQTKLAFKYEMEKIVPCCEEEAVYHCYLPTLDKVVYPFKINSDFSTDPSRKHLTINDISIDSLQQSAKSIFDLIVTVLNRTRGNTYSNLLTILSHRTSFSKINSILSDSFKQYVTSKSWLKINNGKNINPSEYKILPEWLEESEKNFIRVNSKHIQAQSLAVGVYKNTLQVDSFLQQYSQSKYTIEDFIEVMKDIALITNLNPQTQGKIIANIIKTGKSEQYISGKDYLFDDIMMSSDGEAHSISEIAKNTKLKLNEPLKSAISQYASKADIEWFCKKTNIKEKTIINESLMNAETFGSELKKISVSKKLSISKWRSAEQQCVELEKNFGNTSTDVSKQNVGYDVESIGKDGSKRYIEVKSLSSIGSPFSMTNNEYTAAHQYGDAYYLCLLVQTDKKLSAIYIQNPLNSLKLEKRIRQWEWYCESYEGEELSIEF